MSTPTPGSSRTSYSCIPCRTKKIKCDRRLPCNHCRRKRIECAWPPKSAPILESTTTITAETTPTSASSSLAGRAFEIHTSPSQHSTATKGYDTRHQPSDVFKRPSVAPISPSYVPSPSTGKTGGSAVVLPPESVAMAEQFDHSILNNEASSLRAHRRGGGHGSHPKEVRRRRSLFSLDKDEEGLVDEELMRGLPGRGEADMLLRIYLERVEWIHHPLHVPTFVAQYNRFYDMSASDRCRKVHCGWLALLYVVLCLGAHFGDEDRVELEERLFEGAEEALSASDFLNQPTLETIQTVICLNLYLNNRNQVSAARALLAMAIRLAQAMGMARVPEETPDSDRRGVVDREISRRLWWSLVCQDAYTASNGGVTYSINLSHATTSVFANLDDEDLRDGLPRPMGREMTEATVSSSQILKIGFALVVRDFIDAINANFPNAAYSDILALDARFRQVYQGLPLHLRPDLPQPFDPSLTTTKRYLLQQRVFMGITLHNRLLRLHRAYMTRGYTDPTYAYSTRTCHDSAYQLLELVSQSRAVLCKWWVVLVHVWTSGLVIAVDMVRVEQDEEKRATCRRGIELAIALMQPAARTSPVASRGIRVLRDILDMRGVASSTATVPQPEPFPPVAEGFIGSMVSNDTAQLPLAPNDVMGQDWTVETTLAFLESLFPAGYSESFMPSNDISA